MIEQGVVSKRCLELMVEGNFPAALGIGSRPVFEPLLKAWQDIIVSLP
jgi:hypothetical protein